MDGTLRNGVPTYLVEELLDLVATMEERDGVTGLEDDIWWQEAEYEEGTADASLLERMCLFHMAHGDTEEAAKCLKHIRACVAKYYEEHRCLD